MKNLLIIILLTSLLGSCKRHTASSEEEGAKPRSGVQVTSIHYGVIGDNLELSGSALYLQRDIVTASIPAFITKVNCYLGKRVAKGEVLYVLESKERKVLGKTPQIVDNSFKDFGIVQLKAPTAGIISTFDKQQIGDYVLEGTQLCTVVESGSLAIQVNVPYDFVAYTPPGKKCTIILPDGTTHNAVITTPLNSVNTSAQTQSIMARPNEFIFLPENLIVKVVIRKGSTSNKQLLPKSCVQSDEMMKDFWIMKLINDSTAVKVQVAIGNKNDTEVEILTPQLGTSDQIILTGAYGLPDTALVTITK
ncbi:MAG: hypothetical protein JWQ38_3658 [Flavipsychrobacter sp.]|nr:hypothetical protein [Flavipsychrobacter sp.]